MHYLLVGFLSQFLFYPCWAQSVALDNPKVKIVERWILLDHKYKVYTKKAGKGKAKMLLLPGGPGGNHFSYTALEELALQGDMELYFLDYVDCGLSEKTRNPSYWNLANYVEDIEAVRLALHLDQVFLYGHSFGAVVAQEYAFRFPQSLKGLIISNMSYSLKNVSQNMFSIARADSAFSKLLQEETAAFDKRYEEVDTTVTMKLSSAIDSLMNILLAKYDYADTSLAFFKKYQKFTAAIGDTLMNINKEVNQHFHTKEKISSWDFTSRLSGIAVPTLLMAGAHDYAFPLKDFNTMMATIPQVRGVICPGNHSPFMTTPECYFPPILQFIKELQTKKK
jgi:proline iminopeptidase